MEHLTCPNDIASKIEMEFTQDALKAITSQVPEENKDLTEDEEVLCECGAVIPFLRAKKGYDNCVECAAWAEKSNKRSYRARNFEYED